MNTNTTKAPVQSYNIYHVVRIPRKLQFSWQSSPVGLFTSFSVHSPFNLCICIITLSNVYVSHYSEIQVECGFMFSLSFIYYYYNLFENWNYQYCTSESNFRAVDAKLEGGGPSFVTLCIFSIRPMSTNIAILASL